MELNCINKALQEAGFQVAGFQNAHTFCAGATGSGKTKNVIKPNLTQVIGEKLPALVVDPKKELAGFLEEMLQGISGVLIKLDGTCNRVNPFSFDLNMPMAKKVLEMYRTVDGVRAVENGNNGQFAARAEAMLNNFMKVADHYFQKTGRNIFADAFYLTEVVSEPDKLSRYKRGMDDDWDEPAYERVGVNRMSDIKDDKKLSLELSKNTHYMPFFESFKLYVDYSVSGLNPNIHEICYELATSAGVAKTELSFLNPLKQIDSDRVSTRAISEQWFYSTIYLNIFFDLVLDPTVNAYLELEPLSPPTANLSAHWDQNQIVLLVMDPSSNDDKGFDFVVKQIKSFFFKYAFKREDKSTPLYYVCDEFHRFFTEDRLSGEQNFLDRCRSENVTCVLATQSIQSLKNAAELQSGRNGESAVEILLNNAPNMYFFGTKDVKTQHYVDELVPYPPRLGLPKASQARPLSTLNIGEAYVFSQNGDWDIKKFDLDEIEENHRKVMQALPEIYQNSSPMMPV